MISFLRNLILLSFGLEAEQEELVLKKQNTKIKSIHDVVNNDSRLSTASHPKQQQQLTEPLERVSKKQKVTLDSESSDEALELLPSQKKLVNIKDQVEKMKQELKSIDKKEAPKVNKKTAPVSFLEEMRKNYLKSGKVSQVYKGKKESVKVLDKLKQFSSEIRKSAKIQSRSTHPKESWEEEECELHFAKGCQSCKDTFGKEDDADEEGWMGVELKFAKEVGANVYAPKVDDYTVIDPRAALNTKSSDPFGRNLKTPQEVWKDKILPKK